MIRLDEWAVWEHRAKMRFSVCDHVKTSRRKDYGRR